MLPHLKGSFFGPPTSPVFGFLSPSNSGLAPLRTSGCNSSPLPVAATFAFRVSSVVSSFDAGDWFICGLGRAGSASTGGGVGFGVLNAPVDDFCKRSNSSCSLGGRRGGAGPVEKAGRRAVCEKNLREGSRNLGGNKRDISNIIKLLNELRIFQLSEVYKTNQWRRTWNEARLHNRRPG